MKVLEVDNINISHKEKKILKDITFSVNEGEIVALIGPNGAGKTTLMKIISNLLKPNLGTTKICGISTRDNRENYLSNFSSIIETPSLYETLSGLDNIKIICKINNVSKTKMDSILEFIDIGKDIYKKARTYSLGMKQRLALGIALLTEPKLLILDEPTNGLDPQGVIEFRNLLLKLVREQKVSVLISSHILSYLDQICTRVLFIKKGEIIDMDSNNIKSEIQTVILTMENPEKVISIVKEIKFVKEANIIKPDKITIQVNGIDTPNLIGEISQENIRYRNIEILNNDIEKVYSRIYVGNK